MAIRVFILITLVPGIDCVLLSKAKALLLSPVFFLLRSHRQDEVLFMNGVNHD
jgi:hypothetical protein